MKLDEPTHCCSILVPLDGSAHAAAALERAIAIAKESHVWLTLLHVITVHVDQAAARVA